jgi:small conductance mechanosensitive channel
MIAALRVTLQDTAGAAVLDSALAQFDSTLVRLAGWRGFFSWQNILPPLIRVIVIITVALALYRFVRVLIRRLVERDIDEDDPIVKRVRQQRAQTLGSLLGSVVAVVIATVTLLTVLGLFVDIGPLLASVGVLGLAVSFGAQSLVKDVITGTFMLLEGQFAIGDVIRLGDVSGVVEKITLRTTVLRDAEGTVHVIPNGEITRVSNLTKTWSRAVLDVGVAYKEDVDRVIRTLAAIGREFHADPDWNALLVEEPRVLGVEKFADSAVIVRMNAKTLPQKQWDVARELRRRIKKQFDAENIEMPFPHVSLYWGDGQMPPAPSVRAPDDTEYADPERLTAPRH